MATPANGDRVEITVETTLRADLASTLYRHAAKRKRAPVEVLADIVETVLRDDIVDAVLDDGVAP